MGQKDAFPLSRALILRTARFPRSMNDAGSACPGPSPILDAIVESPPSEALVPSEKASSSSSGGFSRMQTWQM